MIGGIRKAKLWATELKNAPPGGELDLTAFRAVAEKRMAAAKKNRGGV
jgi:hypothetical protein